MPTLAKHKKLRYDFEIMDDFEAGIVLSGAEVKSCRRHQIKLEGSYATIEHGVLWLKNAHISPYQLANQPHYDPTHPRRLLLRQPEINSLIGKIKQAGLTLLVESLYTSGSLIKAKLVLARGKKKYDKRQTIKKRETDRKIARAMRRSR